MNSALNIKANGISISYEASETNGLPVIFIHGFPFNKSTWNSQFNFLKEKYKVHIYDIRGFGNSELGQEDVSIALYADDLIKFMDELKIEKAVVCGLSMGGYILLNAVQRYQKRFKGIILSDTQCLADSKENKEKRFETIKEIEKNGLEGFAEKFVKKLFSKDSQENKKHLAENIKKIITSNKKEAVTAALKALANRSETCSDLQSIQLPTLIICGEEDELTPKSQSEFLFNHIPGAELEIIKDAGHLTNIEQTEKFNGVVDKFLSRIS